MSDMAEEEEVDLYDEYSSEDEHFDAIVDEESVNRLIASVKLLNNEQFRLKNIFDRALQFYNNGE